MKGTYTDGASEKTKKKERALNLSSVEILRWHKRRAMTSSGTKSLPPPSRKPSPYENNTESTLKQTTATNVSSFLERCSPMAAELTLR